MHDYDGQASLFAGSCKLDRAEHLRVAFGGCVQKANGTMMSE